MTLSKLIQYQIMIYAFDSHYDVEMKELIFPGYINNKFIDGYMVTLFMAINKLKIPETRVLYGTYGIYRPVCYRTHIFSVMGKAFHMPHTRLIFPGDMMNNNQKSPLGEMYKRYY